MRRAVVSLGVVAIASGIAAAGGIATGAGERPVAHLVQQARIGCGSEGAFVRTAAVLASDDGVHVSVANGSRFQLLEVRSATDELLVEQPIVTSATTRAVWDVPPGPVTVTCVTDRNDRQPRPAGVLMIVDPERRWLSPDLACDEASLERLQVDVESIPGEPAGDTARRAAPGIEPGDELVKPGYPGTLWHGELLLVVRGGEAVGRVTRAQDRGGWNVVVQGCPGSGLAGRGR